MAGRRSQQASEEWPREEQFWRYASTELYKIGRLDSVLALVQSKCRVLPELFQGACRFLSRICLRRGWRNSCRPI